MLPVNDWLNLKFEKQWQDWITGDERCGIEWYTVYFDYTDKSC
jgi:hypothetical protein